jgi:flagella basal body P-ring formation protein FlgA
VVYGPEQPIKLAGNVALAAVTVRQAERRIRDALLQYLSEHAPDAQPWTVDFTLADAQARRVTAWDGRITVRGGQPPWIGPQRFEIVLDSKDRSARGPEDARDRFVLDVRVSLPPAIVITTRSLPRGALIRSADVRLHHGRTLDVHNEAYHSIDEVVGRETTRAIPAEEMIRQSWVRQPLLIRRGEIITVYARSAGIRVRTLARARDDGSLGALIAVESLTDRKGYFARVSGVQEAEVYARPTQADAAAASRSAWPTGSGPAPRASRGRWAIGSEQPTTAPRMAARRLEP